MPITISSPLQKQKGLHPVLLSFLLGMAVALVIFLPFAIVDKGFFINAGDYNLQQIPFYMHVQNFIKTGGGTWSWATDIGSSIINSYTFYNMGSPFLWLTLLFPSGWLPFLMIPLFILKFGCIAASACLYLKRYARTRNMPVICSLIYAFCGFNVYNTFFNHMLEPVIFFALLLWAMDEFVYEGRRGFFALAVAFALLNSYFFFVGNVIFALIYFTVKLITKDYRLCGKKFFWLVFEAVLGVGIGMVLTYPSLLNLLGNPRTDNFANGYGLMLYGNVHQYFNILTSLIIPPDPSYMPNLFREGAIKHTSMSAFLPIVSIAGVFAYCKGRKNNSAKIILLISLLMALVPILNSSFYAFNSSYYARWFYMPILMMCFATLRSLEDPTADLKGGIRLTLILTGVYGIFGLLPKKVDNVWSYGLAEDEGRFWLTFFTAVLGIFIFYIIVSFYKNTTKFAPMMLAAVMGFSAFYSIIHISLSKFPQWEGDSKFRTYMYDGPKELNLPDDQFYRIDTFGMPDNLGLWINKSGLQTFNSVVTPSIYEFYPYIGVKRDVSSKPDTDKYAIRGLLGVRFTIMPIEKQSEFISTSHTQGWRLYAEQGPFAIFENENYVPLGTTYDYFVPMDGLETIGADSRAAAMMRAIGLDAQQTEKYGYLFVDELGEMIAPEAVGENEAAAPWYSYTSVSYDGYEQECALRAASAAYDLQADSSGFTAKIRMNKDNLVFFGVPYDEGFSATVNGVQTEVLKVSAGMMAVYSPAGDNEIVFTYRTPGFRLGIVITLFSLLALACYLLLFHRAAAKKKSPEIISTKHSEANTNVTSNETPASGTSQNNQENED